MLFVMLHTAIAGWLVVATGCGESRVADLPPSPPARVVRLPDAAAPPDVASKDDAVVIALQIDPRPASGQARPQQAIRMAITAPGKPTEVTVLGTFSNCRRAEPAEIETFFPAPPDRDGILLAVTCAWGSVTDSVLVRRSDAAILVFHVSFHEANEGTGAILTKPVAIATVPIPPHAAVTASAL
jgi:hypothetical protein